MTAQSVSEAAATVRETMMAGQPRGHTVMRIEGRDGWHHSPKCPSCAALSLLVDQAERAASLEAALDRVDFLIGESGARAYALVEARELIRGTRRYVTKTGRVLTDADIQALADEAEAGYDVSHLAAGSEEA